MSATKQATLGSMFKVILHWRWLPILATGIVLLVPISAWHVLNASEDQKIRRFVEIQAEVVKSNISKHLDEHRLELNQLQPCPQSNDSPGAMKWRARAEMFIGHHWNIRLLACFNKKGLQQRVTAKDGAHLHDLLEHPHQRSVLDQMQTHSDISAWYTDEKPTLAVVTIPLNGQNSSNNYIVVIIDIYKFLNGVRQTVLPDSFEMAITTSTTMLFNSRTTALGIESPWAVSKRWDGPIGPWTIHVWPTQEMLREVRSRATNIPLIFGPLLAILVGFAVYVIQRSRIRLGLLIESNRRFNAMMGASHEAVFIIDMTSHIISCNQAAKLIFARTEEDMVNRTTAQFYPTREDYLQFGKRLFPALEQDGHYEDEVTLRRADNDTFPAEIKVTQLESLGLLLVIRDLTKHKRADYDVLTGLVNRALFYERVIQALSQANRYGHTLAVLFLDLDDFKPVNDSFGHDVGDELLRQVAQRISSCVRQEDTVARIGGDEFTVLLNKIDQQKDAALIAKNILTALRSTFYVDDHELTISVSIGISLFPHDGSDAEELVKKADQAMYLAKKSGRNNFHFSAE